MHTAKSKMSTTDEAMVATSETQALEDVQDVPSTSCRICMSDQLQHPARIQSCGHCFWSVPCQLFLAHFHPFDRFTELLPSAVLSAYGNGADLAQSRDARCVMQASVYLCIVVQKRCAFLLVMISLLCVARLQAL